MQFAGSLGEVPVVDAEPPHDPLAAEQSFPFVRSAGNVVLPCDDSHSSSFSR
jgi:hypothetical protein